MFETRYKDFIDVVLIMLSQDSTWIVGSRIYGEGRTQISLKSHYHYDRSPGARSRIDRVYTDVKIVKKKQDELHNDILSCSLYCFSTDRLLKN